MPFFCVYEETGPYQHGGLQCAAAGQPYSGRTGEWPKAVTGIPDQEPTVYAAALLHSLLSGWPAGLVLAQMAVETAWEWPPTLSSSGATANNPCGITSPLGLCAKDANPLTQTVRFTTLADGIVAAGLLAHRLYNPGALAYQAPVRNLGVGGAVGDARVRVAHAFRFGVLVQAGTFSYVGPGGRQVTASIPRDMRLAGREAGGTVRTGLQAACVALGASPWAESHYVDPTEPYPGSLLWRILEYNWQAWEQAADLGAVTAR